MAPLLVFGDKFPTAIAMEKDGPKLPIYVRRMTRDEWRAFNRGWNLYIDPPGIVERTSEEREAFEAEQLAFVESAIAENITLDAGIVEDRGEPVTTGAGLVGVFFNRIDILSALVSRIWMENKLPEVLRGKSKPPRASTLGSEASMPAHGGEKQAPIVESAESSAIAKSADATASLDGVPCGPLHDAEAPRVTP